jgi:AraC-like DNA-binding protein
LQPAEAAHVNAERVIFWRDGELGGLELLRAHYVTHSFAPHSHEGFALGVIESGIETFRYRHATHFAPAGAVVVVCPGEAHTGSAALAEGWRYRMLYPDAEMLREVASALSGRPRPVPSFPETVIDDPALASELMRLHATAEARGEPLERSSRLTAAFARLIAHHADAMHLEQRIAPEPELVRRLRAYLEERAASPIRLEDLAALAGMSAFRTLRVFEQFVGMPPHAYLTQIRVARARRLLAQRTPLAQVAALVGFYDQSHLTRHFKRIVGVTPGQYAGGTR